MIKQLIHHFFRHASSILQPATKTGSIILMSNSFPKTIKTILLAIIFSHFFFISNVWSHGMTIPMNASAAIMSPQDGSTLSSPFLVKFGIKNFMIAPAGENIDKAGHFHLLINQDSPLSANQLIPSDKHHLDFDQGAHEVLLTLPPGKHSLQLVVGDQSHEALLPLISKKIEITIVSKP